MGKRRSRSSKSVQREMREVNEAHAVASAGNAIEGLFSHMTMGRVGGGADGVAGDSRGVVGKKRGRSFKKGDGRYGQRKRRKKQSALLTHAIAGASSSTSSSSSSSASSSSSSVESSSHARSEGPRVRIPTMVDIVSDGEAEGLDSDDGGDDLAGMGIIEGVSSARKQSRKVSKLSKLMAALDEGTAADRDAAESDSGNDAPGAEDDQDAVSLSPGFDVNDVLDAMTELHQEHGGDVLNDSDDDDDDDEIDDGSDDDDGNDDDVAEDDGADSAAEAELDEEEDASDEDEDAELLVPRNDGSAFQAFFGKAFTPKELQSMLETTHRSAGELPHSTTTVLGKTRYHGGVVDMEAASERPAQVTDPELAIEPRVAERWVEAHDGSGNLSAAASCVLGPATRYCDVLVASPALNDLAVRDAVVDAALVHVASHAFKAWSAARRNNHTLGAVKRAEAALKAAQKNKRLRAELAEAMDAGSESDGEADAAVEAARKQLEHVQPKDEDSLRDQGYTRPRVLILTPMRNRAAVIVSTLARLLVGADMSTGANCDRVRNAEQFVYQFMMEPSEVASFRAKPADHVDRFDCNTDDSFVTGVRFIKPSVIQVNAPNYYKSDILVASPLGLRLLTGADEDDDRNRHYDFLSSIEVVVVDSTETILMQNLDHLSSVLASTNLPLKKTRDTDYTRVRSYFLDLLGAQYRQTIVLSSIVAPRILNVFNDSQLCRNLRGSAAPVYMLPSKPAVGSIASVMLKIDQVFVRIPVSKAELDVEPDTRFNAFMGDVLPELMAVRKSQGGTVAIYIPSYFDFVRVRNAFDAKELKFEVISEYSSRKQVSRARTAFYHHDIQFLLFTERAYFYGRWRLRGVTRLVFYAPPTFPHFYPELINNMETEADPLASTALLAARRVWTLYTIVDKLALTPILGAPNYRAVAKSDKLSHLFV